MLYGTKYIYVFIPLIYVIFPKGTSYQAESCRWGDEVCKYPRFQKNKPPGYKETCAPQEIRNRLCTKSEKILWNKGISCEKSEDIENWQCCDTFYASEEKCLDEYDNTWSDDIKAYW